jgi:hypothetical protein
VLDAEAAHFLLTEILPLSATAWAAWTAARSSGSSRTAFTAPSASSRMPSTGVSSARVPFGTARWPACVSLGAMRGGRSGSCAGSVWLLWC